jgi:hypothetical protein
LKLCGVQMLWLGVCAWWPVWGAESQAPPSLNAVLQRYSHLGQAFAVPLAYAPFPHPARESGYTYKSYVYRRDGHYHDPRVAVFIPKGFREGATVDLVVYFHGWLTRLSELFPKFSLIEEFAASGKNALLVVPQGPRDAPDSFGGKLEDPDGFRKFVEDLLETLQEEKKLRTTRPGQIILAGHDGGYQVMAAILERGGLTAQIREVYLFDALFGQADKFAAWLETHRGKLRLIYTPYAGTRTQTEEFFASLQSKGQPAVMVAESEYSASMLATNRILFIASQLGHDEVVAQNHAFRDFLKASSLENIPSAR